MGANTEKMFVQNYSCFSTGEFKLLIKDTTISITAD